MKSAEEFSGDTSQRRTSGEHGIKFIEYEVSEMNQVQVRPRQLDEMSANEASTPANDNICKTQLLAQRVRGRPTNKTTLEFSKDLCSKTNHPDDYHVSISHYTGSVAFVRGQKNYFTLQTPIDDGPFCALYVRHERGAVCSAKYFYSDDEFEPTKVLQNQLWMVRWRWASLPIFILGIAFLKAHENYLEERTRQVQEELEQIFDSISTPYTLENAIDIQHLSRCLHSFSIASSNLIRRAAFQNLVLTTIEDSITTLIGSNPHRYDKEVHDSILSNLKSSMRARQYDLDMLPKREETIRIMLLNLISQRDQQISVSMGQLNLEIAQNSREIAEATLRDSSAMRTIAILTMVFLPGTAVATFFSMTMFNWSPSEGVVSNYVWVYFVAAIPLTALVFIAWIYWERRNMRQRQLWKSNTDIIQMTSSRNL